MANYSLWKNKNDNIHKKRSSRNQNIDKYRVAANITDIIRVGKKVDFSTKVRLKPGQNYNFNKKVGQNHNLKKKSFKISNNLRERQCIELTQSFVFIFLPKKSFCFLESSFQNS